MNLGTSGNSRITINTDSRTARQELITWWDQKKLRTSKVLVVGAGALGNEIVKNLTLVGVGHIAIVDMDVIELSNLSRCVFFREPDDGSFKSEVLAREAMRMNPEINTSYYTCPIQELGDAYLTQFNLIIAGLDNREARVWLSSAARRVGKVWIDAAIEGLMGRARTFVPDGPCYACTMSEKDWENIAHRRACRLLGTEEILSGHTPTNATTSSIIAGVQCQEAIKYLCEVDSAMFALESKAWIMIGEQMATFTSQVDIDEYCPFHFEFIDSSGQISIGESLSEFWEVANVPIDWVLNFYDDFLFIHGCKDCGTPSKVGFKDLLKKQGICPKCGIELTVDLHTRIQFQDEISKHAILSDFWPLNAFVEFKNSNSAKRLAVSRSNQ